MLLLGLLLIAATAAFTGLVIADNLSGGPEYHVTVLGNTIATMNSLEIFLSGLALALIFCLGLAMTGTGGVLARRRRLRLREARHARHGRTGDAVPTTPNGTGAPVPAPLTERGTTPQPVAQPRMTEAGTTRSGQAADTATEPADTGTGSTTTTTAPAETTTTSGRPRRHMHLFGH
ncbi:hypothetical protein [Streptacidiphilus neutrinimicus]|uniref:hypothetical protein n=1 Tax=Streptacidiphilus neutrinimicus TaxID=105420 RepID=UPI000AD1892B